MAETLINKTQAGSGIWTADSLRAGEGISFVESADSRIDDNTVAVWNFEDASTWATSSYGNVTSTKTTNASWSRNTTYHKFGEACLYATRGGSGSYIYVIPDAMSGDITVDFWVQTLSAASGTSGERKLETNFGDTSNWTCKVSIEGTSDTQTVNVQNSSKGSFSILKVDSTWHHYVIERDATNGKLYIFLDGEIIVNTSISNSTAASKFAIGFPTSGATYVFDEIRVSNVIRWKPNESPFEVPTAPYTIEGAGATYYLVKNTNPAPDLSSYVPNTATGNNSLTLLGTATSASGATNVGKNAVASADNGIALGYDAQSTGSSGCALGCATRAGQNTIALGVSANASGNKGIAIGYNCKATAAGAIQLGADKTNSTANTFQVFSTTVVNANGKIPIASTDITSLTGYDATKTQVLKNVNGTLTWVDEA